MSDIKEIYKGVGLVGAGFTFLDKVPEVLRRAPIKVGAFDALFPHEDNFLRTRVAQITRITETGLQLHVGKRFDDYVGSIDKDSGELLNFNTCSFGAGWSVSPTDIDSKINPVTGEPMTEEELVAEMQVKAQMYWDFMREVAKVQLITTDTNYTGGYVGNQSYNWYTEFEGGSRPGAVSMQLAANVDHISLFQIEVDKMQEDASKMKINDGFSPLALCGTTFYANRLAIEKNEGLARPLLGPAGDLASQEQPFITIGGFRHATFQGQDGVTYVRMNQSINGTKSVAVNDAWLVPQGIPLVARYFSPAIGRSTTNKVASESYGWTEVSERKGVIRAEESNVLYVSKYPKLIRKLTV